MGILVMEYQALPTWCVFIVSNLRPKLFLIRNPLSFSASRNQSDSGSFVLTISEKGLTQQTICWTTHTTPQRIQSVDIARIGDPRLP